MSKFFKSANLETVVVKVMAVDESKKDVPKREQCVCVFRPMGKKNTRKTFFLKIDEDQEHIRRQKIVVVK